MLKLANGIYFLFILAFNMHLRRKKKYKRQFFLILILIRYWNEGCTVNNNTRMHGPNLVVFLDVLFQTSLCPAKELKEHFHDV